GVATLHHSVAQQKAGFGGVADTKGLNRFFVQAAAGQVFARLGGLRALQVIFKEVHRSLVQVKQHRPLPRFFSFGWTAWSLLGNGDAKFLSDGPNGFGKSDVFDLLHEAEHVARYPAAEAVIELPGRMDGK